MAATPLIADAAFISTMGIAYVAVAIRLARRRVPPGPARLALAMFTLWWAGVAGLFLFSGVSQALRAAGIDAAGLHLAITLVSMISVCAALWGLLYYVTYLFTGRTTTFVPYFVYYVLVFLALAYGATSDAAQPSAWVLSVSRLVILTGPILTAGIVAFLVPVIVACGFYFSLYFRIKDPEQRFRVGTTAVAFILWFGSAILATAFRFGEDPSWTYAGRGIGVLASVLVLLGYWPPRAVRRRARAATGQEDVR